MYELVCPSVRDLAVGISSDVDNRAFCFIAGPSKQRHSDIYSNNMCTMVLIIVWSFMLLTLLIDCHKKFPLTEITLFFKLDFLLLMLLLDALVSAYGFPYNAERDKEHYASAPHKVTIAFFLPTALNSPNLREYASVSMKLCDTDISVKTRLLVSRELIK